jgi:hypothetical protein
MRNANCIFLGDFLQLRPISGNPPYIPLTRLEVKKRIGSAGTFNLWNLFEYEELNINVRQKMDKSYAHTLAEIRQGFCTGENLNSLHKRKKKIDLNHDILHIRHLFFRRTLKNDL